MIVYRLVKGSPLTITELDDNFHDVDDRITAIEDNPAEARSIDEITAVGSSLIILYTDSTEDTVPIPVMTLRGRGVWAPFTAYLPNDIVTANGLIVLVLFAHTSNATFDLGDNDGGGHDYYAELFPLPELTLPPGGGTGYVLSKVSESDYDFEWQARGIPDGGSAGEVLTKLTNDDLDVDWVDPGAVGVAEVVTVSTNTLEIDDTAYQSKYIRCTHAAGCIVTFRADDVVDFDVGVEIHFRQCSGNPLIFVEGSASDSDGEVVFNIPSGFDAATAIEGAVVTFKKVAAGEWDMFGLLSETSV